MRKRKREKIKEEKEGRLLISLSKLRGEGE